MHPDIWSIIISLLSSLIYDGMKSGASTIFLNIKGKTTEKNVREAVNKAVTKELTNKVSQGRIFDCDAMQDYIQYMQPIQKIYLHVFCPGKSIEVSTDELVTTLQEDTYRYLLEKGKNISPLETNEIKEFYNSVVRICDDVCVSLLGTEEVALARLLSRVTENSQKTIVSEINRNTEIVRSEISSQSDMLGQAIHKMSGLIVDKSETFTMAMPKKTALEVMPYKYVGGSEKEQYVKNIILNLRKSQWIHIYGKMFTGKTQTLIRIAEHVASYIWITVKADEFQNVNVKELDLQEDTVIFIDGIPNMAKPGIKEKCLQILSECKEKKCKLITTGYENAEVYTKGFVKPEELVSIELNGLSEDEVNEIMRNHNAPEGLFHTKGYHNFVELCKELPPIVMEVVHRMETNGWKYDNDVFKTIITRRTESMEEQMKYLFLEAVDDEETRRLYYRMVYANRTIKKSWISPIALIPEKIKQSDKNLELLRNRWIYADGNLYRCPNKILQNYAEEQLNNDEKREINEFLIKEIQKHSLEPLDISDLFLYYNRLEKYDAQGILCYQIMEQMMENNVKEYPVSVEMFWQGMPLPKKMSPFIKVMVRTEQLYYLCWRGDLIKDFEARRNELWEIATDDMCKMLVTIYGIRLAMVNVRFSLMLFEDFLTKYHGELNVSELLQKKFDKEETFDLPEILSENSMFSAFNTMIGLYIDKLDDLEMYIDIMEKYFTAEQWDEVENIEGIEAIIMCMLDKVWKKNEDALERYMGEIQRLYSLLSKDKTPIIWKSVVHSYLLGYQNNENYSGAKELYASIESVLKNNPVMYLEIIDEMARIARDNKDDSLEKHLFQWEIQVILQNENVVPNNIMIDSCLLYLDKLGVEDRQEIENVHRAMKLIASNEELQEEFPQLQKKLEAEYWMKIYLIDAIEAEMSGFLLFVEELLEEFKRYEEIAIKSILTKMCHVLGYLSGKFLRNSVPEKFPDGSDYASPKLRMFWNDVKDIEVVTFWKTEKIEMMYYICAALGNKYGLDEIEDRAFQKILTNQNFWSKTFECMYRLESYLQVKLLEQNELSKLICFMKKTYEEQERNEIEKDGEFYFIAREQMIFSIFILQVYQKSVTLAMALCEQLIELIDETQYSEVGQRYYKEYKKVLRLVINEEADFNLLKEAFFLIQKKPELKNMDSGVFPLLLLQPPKSQKENLKASVIRCLGNFRFENDWVMEKYVRMIEML